jgi:hypothetical protein
MLGQPDRDGTIKIRGRQVHPHRYSLCWAGYELYNRKSAEQLTALAQSRQSQDNYQPGARAGLPPPR